MYVHCSRSRYKSMTMLLFYYYSGLLLLVLVLKCALFTLLLSRRLYRGCAKLRNAFNTRWCLYTSVVNHEITILTMVVRRSYLYSPTHNRYYIDTGVVLGGGRMRAWPPIAKVWPPHTESWSYLKILQNVQQLLEHFYELIRSFTKFIKEID